MKKVLTLITLAIMLTSYLKNNSNKTIHNYKTITYINSF